MRDEESNGEGRGRKRKKQGIWVYIFGDKSRTQVVFSIMIMLYSFASMGDTSYYVLMKSEFNIGPGEISWFNSVTTIGFLFKPLYGILTDTFPIFGYRRKSYIVLSALLATLLFLALGFFPINPLQCTLFLFFINLNLGILNAVTEALVVQDSQIPLIIQGGDSMDDIIQGGDSMDDIIQGGESMESMDIILGESLEPHNLSMVESPFDTQFLLSPNQLQNEETHSEALSTGDNNQRDTGVEYDNKRAITNISLFYFLDFVVLMITGYLAWWLIYAADPLIIFSICASVTFLMAITGGIFLKENRRKPNIHPSRRNNTENHPLPLEEEIQPSVKQQIQKLWWFLSEKEIYLPLIFIFIFTLKPSLNDGMTYFYLDELKFSYNFQGILSLLGYVAAIIGIIIYKFWLHKYSFKVIMVYTTLVFSLFNLLKLVLVLRINLQLGIPDKSMAILLNLTTKSLSELQLMPVLVLACKICPKNIEAFIFETIMGLKELGYTLSYLWGGGMNKALHIHKGSFHNLWILIILNTALPLISLIILCFVPIRDTYKKHFDKVERRISLQ